MESLSVYVAVVVASEWHYCYRCFDYMLSTGVSENWQLDLLCIKWIESMSAQVSNRSDCRRRAVTWALFSSQDADADTDTDSTTCVSYILCGSRSLRTFWMNQFSESNWFCPFWFSASQFFFLMALDGSCRRTFSFRCLGNLRASQFKESSTSRLLRVRDIATSSKRNRISHTHSHLQRLHISIFLIIFATISLVCACVHIRFSHRRNFCHSLSIYGVRHNAVNARTNVSNYPKMNEPLRRRTDNKTKRNSKRKEKKNTLNWSLNEKIDRTAPKLLFIFRQWFCCVFFFHFSTFFHSFFAGFGFVSVSVHIYFGDADVHAAACKCQIRTKSTSEKGK